VRFAYQEAYSGGQDGVSLFKLFRVPIHKTSMQTAYSKVVLVAVLVLTFATVLGLRLAKVVSLKTRKMAIANKTCVSGKKSRWVKICSRSEEIAASCICGILEQRLIVIDYTTR